MKPTNLAFLRNLEAQFYTNYLRRLILPFVLLVMSVIASNLCAQDYPGCNVVNLYVENNQWEISINDLLNYDNSPNGLFIGIADDCLAPYDFIGKCIYPAFDNISGKFLIEGPLPVGIYHFCPQIYHQGSIKTMVAVVVVSEKEHLDLANCYSEDCNLVCDGDFESYPMLKPDLGFPSLNIFDVAGTEPFTFPHYYNKRDNYPANYAYISSDGSGRMLFLTDIFSPHGKLPLVSENNDKIISPQSYSGDLSGESGFVMPLSAPIAPDETVEISFDATMFGNQDENESINKKVGYVRLYAMTGDITTNSGQIQFPLDNTQSPFVFTRNRDLGYYIASSLDKNKFGIPVQGETVDDYAPRFFEKMVPLTAVTGMDEFENKVLQWKNTTGQNISHIMIIGDGYTMVDGVKAISRLSNQPLYRVVVVDNFQVHKVGLQSLCVEGTSIAACSGKGSYLLNYKVCRWDDQVAKTLTFDVFAKSEYDGIKVIRPGGDFDADGKATITLGSNDDCTQVQLEIEVEDRVIPGSYSIPLRFDTDSSSHALCATGVLVKNNLPAEIVLTDCPFTCLCEEVNNIGAKNTITTLSSLTQAQKDQDCLSVEGYLYIDQDVTIFKKEFIMQDGSAIVVEDNRVHFEQCYFHGCDYLWYGIYATHENAVVCLTESIMEDAETGIYRQNAKALIAVFDSKFNNNLQGIFLPYDHLTSSDPVTPCVITGCTFTSKQLLGYPNLDPVYHIGYIGIYVNSSNEVLGGVGIGQGNSFSNLGNGIFSVGSTIAVNNSSFTDIQTQPFYLSGLHSGNGIYHNALHDLAIIGGIDESGLPANQNIFKNVDIGIQAVGSLIANNTTMEVGNTGIRVGAVLETEIHSSNNDIHAKRFGYDLYCHNDVPFGTLNNNKISIPTSSENSINFGIRAMMKGRINHKEFNFRVFDNVLDGGNKMTQGIFVNNAGFWKVENNHISSSADNFTGITIHNGDQVEVISNSVIASNLSRYTTGISLSKFQNSVLRCNLMEGTDIGLTIRGVCMASECITNEFKSNSFKGLFMNKTSTFTSTTSKDGSQVLAGNLWTGSQNSVPAIHLGTASTINLSAFRTHGNTLPVFPTGFYAINQSPNNHWFASGETGNDKTAEECDLLTYSNEPAWLRSFAFDSVEYAQYDPSMRVQGRNLAFQYMIEHPDLEYSQDLINFYNSYAQTAAGKLTYLYLQFNDIIRISYADRLKIQSYRAQMLPALENIRKLQDKLITKGWSGIDEYKTAVVTHSAQIKTQKKKIKSIIDQFVTSRNSALANILQQVALVTPETGDISSYYLKREMNLEIQYYLGGLVEMPDYEARPFLSIAALCPDYAGPAVNRARSFVMGLYPQLFWDDSNCDDFTPAPLVNQDLDARIKNKQVNDAFRAYPNPSSGMVVISAPEDFTGRILIRNIFGQIVSNKLYLKNMMVDLGFTAGQFIFIFIDNENKVVSSIKQVILN